MCSKDKLDANLSLWQQRNFSLKKGCSVSDKSRYHITNFFQLSNDERVLGEDDPFSHLELEEELHNYGNIVDESDPASGLDNYAKEALSLVANVEAENESWKSCFTPDTVVSIPFVQNFISKSDPWHKKVEHSDGNVQMVKSSLVTPPTRKFNFKKTAASPINNWRQKPSVSCDDRSANELKVDKSPPINSRWPKKRKTEMDPREKVDGFRTARDQLAIEEALKGNKRHNSNNTNSAPAKKSLGSRPRGQCYAKFIPPNRGGRDEENDQQPTAGESSKELEAEHPKLKGIEPALIELIKSEIMDHGNPIDWNDIAGLEYAKATIKEIVIWPMLRPDLFTGLRGPPKGILLFGPPGTGKTLIGKCIASQSHATFFSISASSLTSKWIGQGEKMVRALFAVAEMNQPAVIFIDEIDSLLSQRSESEHESSRRIKTEFLIHLDGATTSTDDRILVVGATNRPQEIDEAARRRLVKRLYIPLPDGEARKQIISKLLTKQTYQLTGDEVASIVDRTDGYSGADVTNLCKEAALGPIRSLRSMDITRISKDDVRPIQLVDFDAALKHVKSSVSQDDLTLYLEWNRMFGCGSI